MKNWILTNIITTVALATSATATPELKVTSITANESGFSVNSHLIEGQKELILIDGQFTRSQAREVVSKVKSTGKKLTTIFVTHAHPDHYFGVEILKKEFPQVKVLAAPETVKEIEATGKGKLDYWKGIYKEDLTDTVPVVTAFNGKVLMLDNQAIEIMKIGKGESETSSALYIASLKALFTGDMAYGNVHLWLAENRPSEWISNLSEMKKSLNIEKVYTGHGTNGTAEILDVNARYIQDFMQATELPTTAEKAKAKMLSKYGKYLLPVILDLSLGARVK